VTARLLHNIVTQCHELNQNVHKFTRRRITRRFGLTKTERQINTNYHLRLQNYFTYKTTCARFNFDPEYLSLTIVRVLCKKNAVPAITYGKNDGTYVAANGFLMRNRIKRVKYLRILNILDI